MLHGASAILAIRNPILLSHMFVASYPYLPDTVKAAQLGGGVYFPPIFYKAGVGLSADDVDIGREYMDTMRALFVGERQ